MTSLSSLAQKVFALSIMVFRTKCEISKRVIYKLKLTCVVHQRSNVASDAETRNQDGPCWYFLDFEGGLHVGILVINRVHFCLLGVLLCLRPLVHWFCFLNRGNALGFPIILHFYVTFFLPKCVIRWIHRVLPVAFIRLWLCMLNGWHTP